MKNFYTKGKWRIIFDKIRSIIHLKLRLMFDNIYIIFINKKDSLTLKNFIHNKTFLRKRD